jgi:hypothetical protein
MVYVDVDHEKHLETAIPLYASWPCRDKTKISLYHARRRDMHEIRFSRANSL